MLVTIQKTVSELVEIPGEFPLFLKYGSELHKVLSEDKMITVRPVADKSKAEILIEDYMPLIGIVMKGGTEISEEYFISKVYSTFKEIQKHITPTVITEFKKAI